MPVSPRCLPLVKLRHGALIRPAIHEEPNSTYILLLFIQVLKFPWLQGLHFLLTFRRF